MRADFVRRTRDSRVPPVPASKAKTRRPTSTRLSLSGATEREPSQKNLRDRASWEATRAAFFQTNWSNNPDDIEAAAGTKSRRNSLANEADPLPLNFNLLDDDTTFLREGHAGIHAYIHTEPRSHDWVSRLRWHIGRACESLGVRLTVRATFWCIVGIVPWRQRPSLRFLFVCPIAVAGACNRERSIHRCRRSAQP
jgi:hypothetical protein